MAIVDMISHHTVNIAAPEDRVWPWILEPNRWKQGPELKLLEGGAGNVGARFGAVLPADPTNILYHVAAVEVVPRVRRTLRLNALDGSLIGFSSWRLSGGEDTTIVDYDVYTQASLDLTVDAIATLCTQSDARFQAELEALRALVEHQE
jgi:hypothetical protein